MDYKDLLIKLSEGKETAQEREFVKNTIAKFVRQTGREKILKARWGDDYVEELFLELRLRVIHRRSILEEKTFISWFYLLSVVRSCVEEFYHKLRSFQEIPYELLNPKTEEDRRSIEEKKIFAYEEKVEEKTEGQEFYEIMLDLLGEKDYPVLCYYICKEVQKDCRKPKGISEANLYKRWERLKRKLRDHLPYEPSNEAIKYFTNRFLSEICHKHGLI